MPTPIDTAYVLIRPDFSGFSAEAATKVRSSLVPLRTEVARGGQAFRGATTDLDHFNRGLFLTEARALGLKSVLGGVSALFIGGAGVATLVHTAAQEFSDMSTVNAKANAVLKATEGAANVTAAAIDKLATAQEHRTGIDDEAIKSAETIILTFRRVQNLSGAGNDIFTRATKGALDLSQIFGGLDASALQLGRALEDPTRGVNALRRAGVTFTTAQQKQIKALQDTGQLLAAQKIVLREVERQVGGTAEAVGRTLPGQLNILRERAKDALGEYVRRLSESRDASDATAAAGGALAAGFDVVKRAVETLGPPLVATAKAAAAVERAIGGGSLVAAVIGYKAVGVAVGLAGRVQVAYAKATAIATGANVSEAASAVAVTASARAEATSLAGASLALRGYSTGAFAATETNAVLAASNVAVASTSRAAAIGAGASRLALAAVGGPLGAVAIGLGAVAAGFILLRRSAANAPGTINAARRALEGFNEAAKQTREIRLRVTGGQQAIADARAQQQAAREALAAATGRQAASTAPTGSLEQRALADQVRTARVELAKATDALARAEKNLSDAQTDAFNQQQRQPQVVSAATQAIVAQVAAIRDLAAEQLVASRRGRVNATTTPTPSAVSRAALQRFLDLTNRLSASGTRADRVVGQALGRIAAQVGRLPTRKEIEVVIRFSTTGKTVDQIIKEAGVGVGVRDETQLLAQAQDRAAAAAAANTAENTALQQQFAAAQKILKTQKDILKTRREDAATAKEALTSAQDAVTNAIDSLTSANESLAASQRALADSIKQGQNAITAAVRDAKSNLRSIASSIADAIGRAADEGALKIGPQGPLAAKFKQLRAQILAGRGGPDTQRAAQQVAARLQAQQPGDDAAAKAKRALDDLTNAFTRGRIKPAQFNDGITKILKDAGLNFKAFGKTFGQAALQDLKDNIAAAKKQAAAIAAGPSRPGSGAEPNIIRPADAVIQAQRDTRDAVQNVERAQRDVGRAGRQLQKEQNNLTKAANADLKAIRGVVTQQLKVTKQQKTLTGTKQKPTGAAGKTANDLTASGASAP